MLLLLVSLHTQHLKSEGYTDADLASLEAIGVDTLLYNACCQTCKLVAAEAAAGAGGGPFAFALVPLVVDEGARSAWRALGWLGCLPSPMAQLLPLCADGCIPWAQFSAPPGCVCVYVRLCVRARVCLCVCLRGCVRVCVSGPARYLNVPTPLAAPSPFHLALRSRLCFSGGGIATKATTTTAPPSKESTCLTSFVDPCLASKGFTRDTVGYKQCLDLALSGSGDCEAPSDSCFKTMYDFCQTKQVNMIK
jgi:hypothetical protein